MTVLLRLGRVVNFISHTVVVGFTAGAALLIVTSQLRNFFGIEVPTGSSFLSTWGAFAGQLADVKPWVLLVGALTLAAGLAGRRLAPKLPYMIVALAVGGLAGFFLNLALGEARLAEHIRTIGLYRTKAKNVMALTRLLVERHGGEVPRDRAALEALPGVGRKTANVVLNVAFGEPTIAVDTHIFRVANRTGLAPGKDPLAVERRLLEVTPPEFRRHAHHWLILHGRYVCVARKPRCAQCALRDLCAYRGKTRDG